VLYPVNPQPVTRNEFPPSLDGGFGEPIRKGGGSGGTGGASSLHCRYHYVLISNNKKIELFLSYYVIKYKSKNESKKE